MVDTILKALKRISHPRYYQTERGYQGELNALLSASLREGEGPRDAIAEEEAQKRLGVHHIRRRPDIIIHCPTPKGSNPRVRNYAVILLKLQAGLSRARQDFEALDDIIEALDYPLGLFINIASDKTYSNGYQGNFPERLHFLATRLLDGKVLITHDRVERSKNRFSKLEERS